MMKKKSKFDSDEVLVTFKTYKSYCMCKSNGYIIIDSPQNKVGVYSAEDAKLIGVLPYTPEGEYVVAGVEHEGYIYAAFSSGSIVRVKVGNFKNYQMITPNMTTNRFFALDN